ncbi:hypothetical protein [Providencia burhodogranariea]|uniref:DUF2975 domain-containing protein n=1 Tax=Providencia burhodogranariea DSM 19968 TaxID=1141662 RepID=K8X0N5_9GAMM|nr:hypothetical protein [Providencia burhodogranariea]EKT62025.1 hypothetical protein OOA_09041 [Providencia burhodogranariea DSM 19968]
MLKSNKKIFLIAKSIAFITWVLGVTDLILKYLLWSSHEIEMLEGIIENLDSHAAIGTIEVSDTTFNLLMLISYLPTLFSSLSLFFIGYFFFRVTKEEIWSQKNIKTLFIAGILAIITPIVYGMQETFESLALSLSLPESEKIFVFYLGFSSSAAHEVIYGIIILSLSLIMKETKKLSDENKQYI